ncbi:DUF1214 domain-containing protein [Microbacterium sp.]|uniref:DUF1214 domain-containing protein n=1 Tax=Microbacterium sp. TaxID=51671 RepID=UPI0025D6BAB0|nr:DUF1214 domain-containing protein [Microbacterium sp.]
MTNPAIPVTVDNFVRAETDTMFDSIVSDAGGTNKWTVQRAPVPLDHQPIIRLNRDTLYSGAVVDVTAGATLTLPDAGGRYISAMVVNQDHHIPLIVHDAGPVELVEETCGSPFVMVGVRILVDPTNPADVAEVNRLQDLVRVTSAGGRDFFHPLYDPDTHVAVRGHLLALAKDLPSFAGAFGDTAETDPIHHLLGTAAGWGGLPEREAVYLNVEPHAPVGDYELIVQDVPVDAFWSVSVYDKDGYFAPNERHSNTVNSVTARREPDGSTIVRFGSGDLPNTIPVTEGWNYLVRLYRPRPAAVTGEWHFPTIRPR